MCILLASKETVMTARHVVFAAVVFERRMERPDPAEAKIKTCQPGLGLLVSWFGRETDH